jgi:opacity protein-like surface antigen
MQTSLKLALALLSVMFFSGSVPAFAADRPGYVRALLGNSQISDKDLYVKGIDSGTGEDVVFSGEYSADVPFVGIAGQMPFRTGRLELGIESAFLFGWKTDSVSIAGNNNAAIVYIDNSMNIFDISFGGFIGLFLTQKLRIYGGAGAAYIRGSIDIKDDEMEDSDAIIKFDNTDSDNAFGKYAHAGIEYWYENKSSVGLSGRLMDVELNFNQSLGKVDMESRQFFITFTQVFR